MYYGDKQSSKVVICHTLSDLGWKIYGYKGDNSDAMTDYYDPASWGGIATKNGFVLCVDISGYQLQSSGKQIKSTNASEFTITKKAQDKINQLNLLANDKAATPGEKAAALEAAERIKKSADKAHQEAENSIEVLDTWPTFQQNPPNCNWHIEKNGKITAKGNGAFQFHSLKYCSYDLMTSKPNGWHRDTPETPPDYIAEDLKKFQAFIKKIEAAAAVKIGDSVEGEPVYKNITVTEYKTENKAQPIPGNTVKIGDTFILNDYFSGDSCKGYVYKVRNILGDTIFSNKMNGKLNKMCDGMASRKNFFTTSPERLAKWIDTGKISLVKIVEVKTPYQVEKCVRVDPEGREKVRTTTGKYTYQVKEDIDTRDNSKIYVVKIAERLSPEEYKAQAAEMKKRGGYYSKFKHGFIFKEYPDDISA
jgi:hypothetical protein